MRKQAYILPIRGGWAVNVFGDEVIEDGTIVPLPFGDRMTFEDVLSRVEALPVGAGAIIDGWATRDELAECEPELFAATAV